MHIREKMRYHEPSSYSILAEYPCFATECIIIIMSHLRIIRAIRDISFHSILKQRKTFHKPVPDWTLKYFSNSSNETNQ